MQIPPESQGVSLDDNLLIFGEHVTSWFVNAALQLDPLTPIDDREEIIPQIKAEGERRNKGGRQKAKGERNAKGEIKAEGRRRKAK